MAEVLQRRQGPRVKAALWEMATAPPGTTKNDKTKQIQNIMWNLLYKAAQSNSTFVSMSVFEKHWTIKKLCLKMLQSYLFYIRAALRGTGNFTCLLTSRFEYE
jgi:hypothetical protein